MNHHDMHTEKHREKAPPFWKSSSGVVVIMLASIAAFYLLREHWAHVLGNWPYLLLLLCPLMHVFGHGHGGHGEHGHHDDRAPSDRTPSDGKDS